MKEHNKKKLTELEATAICGNDITSSCLYVSALTIVYAGKWAWVSLLMVAAVLFLYRKIYGEVVGALPLNGGAYNALLNTTSKFLASMAACLTILSYMATAVLSANEAMHYAHSLWDQVPIMEATIGLLAIFMVLAIIGIGESAKVAVGIFVFHIGTIVLLITSCLFYIVGQYFATGSLDVLMSNNNLPMEGDITQALFFGFAAAMLGISGFESSANFVEEQAPGVFPKTLRNMWLAVSLINPITAFMVIAVIPIAVVGQHQEALLAHLGLISGGSWLAVIVSIDATLVLSGAVLTSYVGVTGLVYRLALDRCLPQFVLFKNAKGTPHRIIIGFFLLSVSVLLITKGDLKALAGVYTISFLAVMALFGIGNLLLKVKRTRLARPERASWISVLVAIAAVLAALIGNITLNPIYFGVFLEYFIPAAIVIILVLGRISILTALLFVVKSASESVGRATKNLTEMIQGKMEEINSQEVVFFTRGGEIANLNLAMWYVRNNEHTNRIKIVTIVADKADVPQNLAYDIKILDRAYPEIDIEFIVYEGLFGPKLIQELSKKWNIPCNLMFMGCPDEGFSHSLADLGGVRLIV